VYVIVNEIVAFNDANDAFVKGMMFFGVRRIDAEECIVDVARKKIGDLMVQFEFESFFTFMSELRNPSVSVRDLKPVGEG
jgi:hypothetical protein